MPLASGDIFAGYSIVHLLGSGGMGEVYLAQHPRLPRRDAVKLLPPEWSADEEYRARFNREADLASTLWHPHIVGVHDRGEEDGQLWISMDYVDGLDTARLMSERYPTGMPPADVARIVAAVASALDYAHKQGLLHRDVKPANIMMTHVDDNDGDQRILLTDFGIARNANDISGLTRTNMTVGTVAYCAPEQLLGNDIDGRTDQYALAATAYHLLTGSNLFSNSNPAVVISRHLNVTPPLAADTRAGLAAFDPILQTALTKDPGERFSRCTEFARAFSEQINASQAPTQASLTALPAIKARSAMSSTSDRESATAAKSIRVKRLWQGGIAAGVAIVAILGTVIAWRPWESESPQPPARPASIPPPAVATSEATISPPLPPPPPTYPSKAIDQVLLSSEQLTRVLGFPVSSSPAASPGTLPLTSSSYGTSDHSEQVTPRSCVGVVFTGEHQAYTDAEPTAIKTQTFGNPLYDQSSAAGGPYVMQQTGAVFATTQQAEQFLESSQRQWNSCNASEVDATLGYENGRGYTLGKVTRVGDLITVPMASPSGERSADACQQALGVQRNVVVEVRTCSTPDATTPGYSDPNWARSYAERVASAMLKNVAS